MRLALNAATIKPAPLLEKIRIAAQAGFEGIELWAVDLYEHVGRAGEISDVETALADHGLEVPCVIAVRNWGETQGWEHKLALDEARRRMELSARLRAPFIVCTPPLERPGIEGLAEGYAKLLELGRQTGVRPLLEYISFFASLNNLPDALSVLDRCGDADGALVIDAFHTWNSQGSPELLEAIPLERVAHYHIDDAAPDKPAGTQRDPDRVLPGDGPIDLTSELAILHRKGYRGWISLEVFNETLWRQDPLEVARTGFTRVQQILQRAGALP